MTTTQEIPQQSLGVQGEPCKGCGSPLASDQRYCLNCGKRRGESPIAYADYLGAGGANGVAPPGQLPATAPVPAPANPWAAALGIALLGGLVLVGVLIGRGGDEGTVTAAAPVAAAEGTAADTSETVSAGAVKSEW